jgi:hypothetical protein
MISASQSRLLDSIRRTAAGCARTDGEQRWACDRARKAAQPHAEHEARLALTTSDTRCIFQRSCFVALENLRWKLAAC